jgi:serine/threonine protein kinase
VDRAAFDALARTLHLDEVALAPGETLRRGTLTLARDSIPNLDAPASTATIQQPLPVLEVSRSESLVPGSTPGTAEFVLRSPLGEGGMGVVWLARQASLGRDVAVKRLRDEAWSANSISALLVEARATGALEHPSIVPVHALGVDGGGAPLLVMKRVEGASVAELLMRADHPSWPELERRYGDRLAAKIEVLGKVADALHFAHSRGFIHRDVKPENVMVGSFGEVYLLDWGLALRFNALTIDDRASVSIVGTPGFMAPEMIAGRAEGMDPRTDVYLLGATLHALLTGQPRHVGDTLRQIMVSAAVSDPIEYPASVPAELAALANRATSGDRDDRPKTAAEFREKLTEYLRHRGSLRLAEEARDRLEDIEGRALPRSEDAGRMSQDPDTAAALVEARFAFTQALREWPGNALAKDGLRRSLLLMVEAEIRRRSPEAATELARQLDPPEPSLEPRIEALREAVAESRRFEDAARRDVHERDRRIGALLGVFIQSGLVLAIGGLSAVGAWQEWNHGGAGYQPSRIFAWAVGLLVSASVTLVVFRSRALANRWGRQMSALLVVVLAAAAASSGIVMMRNGTGSEAAAQMMTALAAVMAGGGIALDRRLSWSAGASLIAGISCTLWPASTPLAVGLAGIVAVAVFLPESIQNAREQIQPPKPKTTKPTV